MEQALENFWTNQKVREALKYIAKSVAITLTFSALYFGLCMLNPVVAKSSLVIGVFGKGVRVANMLRVFALWNPYTAVGMTLGAQWFDLSLGRAFMFPWDGILQIALGFGAYNMSKKWGRKWYKDLTILFVYGILGSLVSSLNSATITAFFLANGYASDIFKDVIKDILAFKVVTRTALVMLGYPLFVAFNDLKDRYEKSSSTK